MRHIESRCQHCRARYFFQASGWGAGKDNSSDYCPDCAAVIREALSKVPRRVEMILQETDEITAVELEALDKERWEAAQAQANGGLTVRRVLPGLFDLQDPSNRDHRGITKKDGRTYHWNYWSKDPEGTSQVRVELEKDLETGELTPWKHVHSR